MFSDIVRVNYSLGFVLLFFPNQPSTFPIHALLNAREWDRSEISLFYRHQDQSAYFASATELTTELHR